MKKGAKQDVLVRPIVLRAAEYKNEADFTRAWQAQMQERVDALKQRGWSSAEALVPLLVELDAPGFKTVVLGKKAPGRPARWGFMRLFFLWLDVQRAMEGKKYSAVNACKYLRSEGKKGNNDYGGSDNATLLRRFHEAQKSPMVKGCAEPALKRMSLPEFLRCAEGLQDGRSRAEILQHDVRP